VDDGVEVGVLRGLGGELMEIDFHPEGKLLATAGPAAITLSRISPWTSKSVFSVSSPAYALDFSPDGRRLASGERNGSVRLWNVARAESREVGRHAEVVYSVEIDRTGSRLLSASADGTARVWALDGEGWIELRGHRGEVNIGRFSRDGRHVATGSDDGTVRLWNATDGRPIWRCPLLLQDPLEAYTHLGWRRFGDTGQPVETARWREAVETKARRAEHSATGDHLCLLTYEGGLEMWDLAADEQLGETTDIDATHVLPVRDGCVVRGRNGVSLYGRGGSTKVLAERDAAVGPIAEGGILLSAVGEREIVSFDEHGERRRTLSGELGVTVLRQRDRRILLGYQDGRLEIRRVGTLGELLHAEFEGTPSTPVTSAIFGPADIIIVGYADGFIGFWSVHTGELLRRAQLHGPVVHQARRGARYVAVSELGDFVELDLSIFSEDRCTLLRTVWQEVPLVWESGELEIRPARADHPCTRD